MYAIRTKIATLAAVAAAGALILTGCTPADGNADAVEQPTTTPTVEATETTAPTPTPTPTPEKVDPTEGLTAGDALDDETCQEINDDVTLFGHCYVMTDGSGGRFTRYGDPISEEIRLDVERSVQGLPADTVFLTEADRIAESLDGLEVGFLVCYDGWWASSKPSPHGGGHDEMVADLQAWVDAGSSRSYVTVNQC